MGINQIYTAQIDSRNVSQSYVIDSWNQWPCIWISSGIHGNEHFWVRVTSDFLEKIKSWNLKLLRWEVALILAGNEEALFQSERFLQDDLNRVVNAVLKEEIRDNYEQRRWREIKTLIDTFEPESWLDLHSFSAPKWEPYMFSWLKGYEVGKWIWVQNMAVNMANANKNPTWIPSWQWVADYVNFIGSNWFTFEAGNHTDPQCYINTYQALINFLVSHDMLSPLQVGKNGSNTLLIPSDGIIKIGKPWESQHVHIEEKHIFTGRFDYIGEHPESFKQYKAWEIIWYDIYPDGRKEELIAPFNGYIVLPKDPNICIVWKEVFYYGKAMSEI